jgi:thiamine-phosphate pyrophosphorylase
VTPEEPDTARLAEMVEAALAGGARLLQYRNKEGSAALRLEQAAALHAICRRYGAPLIVNDDVELAMRIGAEGVHLGRDDPDPAHARRHMPQALIGVSCYNELERAVIAERDGADYVAFGRFFSSTTKPGDIRASTALVREARPRLSVPIVAIGGITAQNAPPLIEAGVDALAVVAGVFGAADVQAAARRIAALYA